MNGTYHDGSRKTSHAHFVNADDVLILHSLYPILKPMTNQQKTIVFWLGSVLGVVVIVFYLVTIQQKRENGVMGNQV